MSAVSIASLEEVVLDAAAHGGSLDRDVQDRAKTKLEELYARFQ